MNRRDLKRLDARAISIEEPLDLAPYQRPMQPIPERVEQAIARGVTALPAGADPRPAALFRPGGDGMVDGAYRLADGRLFVACLTDMPGVDPLMWDWWFGWHLISSARYRLWHPLEHVAARLADPAPEGAPLRSRYIGKVSFVDEHIGPSPVQKLGIAFQPPSAFGLDQADVDAVGTAICARTWLSEPGIGAGRLVHLVRKTNNGSEMLSRFSLGDVDTGNLFLNLLANTAPPRRRRLPDNAGLYLLRHCASEMGHLARILPELYGRFGSE
jgi:hypothetical protein